MIIIILTYYPSSDPASALIYACSSGQGEIVRLLTTASFVGFKDGKTKYERPIGAIPAYIVVNDKDESGSENIDGSGKRMAGSRSGKREMEAEAGSGK